MKEKMASGVSRLRVPLAICQFLLLASLALAQSGGGYDLSWWTADGGGGTSSGGDYMLSGTAGQAEGGVLMQGGDYALTGGLWPGGATAAPEYFLHVPLVMGGY
jgi:hypothetical protein